MAFIPLDAFSFMQTLAGNPDSYGFTNVTDAACGRKLALICGPADYVVPNADMTYLFADDVHLSTAANQMLGQYAISVLEARTIKRLTRPWVELVGRPVYEQVILSLMHRSPTIRSLKAASRLTHGYKPYLELARIGCRGWSSTVTT